MIWLALSACHSDRVAAVQADLELLEAELVELHEERAALQAVLDDVPPPTKSKRHDLMPQGYTPEAPLPKGHPRRPDVVVLSIDTLRADHLGSYGYERPTSPFFDELAGEGTRFAEAWSPAPWTLPSHATMLSGQLPHHHGAIEDHLRLADDVPLVSSAFQRAGYRTAAVVATLFVSSRYGFDRGFHHFQDFGIRDKEENHLSLVDADHVFAHALDFARAQAPGRPLFLFLHVYDVHYGYDPPEPFDVRFDRGPAWGDEKYKSYHAYARRMIDADQLRHQIAQYDEEIAFVDHHFRRFVQAFRDAGRNVVVAVTSDHGEEFGERGSWGHGHTLWPEQLHVPWIVHGPGVKPQVVDQRVGLEDLAVTMADLAGVRFSAPDGVSRARVARGQSPRSTPEAARFAATSRFETLVLRWHDQGLDLYVDVTNRQRALCDRSVDPACRTNLYRLRVADGQRLFGDLMGYLGEPWEALEGGTVLVDQGTAFKSGQRHNHELMVEPGERFNVLPGDARVRFVRDHAEEGPFRPLGGTVPGRRCGLSFSGRAVVDAELTERTDDEREMLRALGYLQDDGPVEVTPSGTADCPPPRPATGTPAAAASVGGVR